MSSARPIAVVRAATVPFFVVTQLKGQIEALLAAGMQVTVVTSPGPELAQMPVHPGLRLHATEIRRDISPGADWRAFWEIFRLLSEDRPDIVHSTTPKAGLLIAVAALLARVPVRLHTFTGQAWVGLAGPKRWTAWLADWVVGVLSTMCYADSQSQRLFLISKGVIAEDRISVIGQGSLAGVDIERFNRDRLLPGSRKRIRKELGVGEDVPVVLFIGRLAADKGVRELLLAAKQLYSAGMDFCLLLVGPMDSEAGGKETISRADFDRLKFVRYVGYTPLPEYYYGVADVFCLPSYREGFGTTVIEAAAMGLPTVGTRINGLIDAVVDEETGLLVEPRNASALALALRRILTAPGLRERLGSAARARAIRYFSSDQVNAAVANEYARLLNGVL